MRSKAFGNFVFVRSGIDNFLGTNNFSTNSRYFSVDAEKSEVPSKNIKKSFGRLIVSRHGETDFNILKIWAGWHNARITKEGEEQARVLGRTLKEINFSPDVVYATQLERAELTAKIALSEMEIVAPIKKDARMLEQHVGDLTGERKTEAGKKLVRGPESRPKAMTMDHPYHVTNSKDTIGEPLNGLGAESRSDVIIRTGEFFEKQLKADIKSGLNVFVVAHSNSLKAFFDYISRGKKREDIVIGNAEPIEVKFKSYENDDIDFEEIVKISSPSTKINFSEIKNLKAGYQYEIKDSKSVRDIVKERNEDVSRSA